MKLFSQLPAKILLPIILCGVLFTNCKKENGSANSLNTSTVSRGGGVGHLGDPNSIKPTVSLSFGNNPAISGTPTSITFSVINPVTGLPVSASGSYFSLSISMDGGLTWLPITPANYSVNPIVQPWNPNLDFGSIIKVKGQFTPGASTGFNDAAIAIDLYQNAACNSWTLAPLSASIAPNSNGYATSVIYHINNYGTSICNSKLIADLGAGATVNSNTTAGYSVKSTNQGTTLTWDLSNTLSNGYSQNFCASYSLSSLKFLTGSLGNWQTFNNGSTLKGTICPNSSNLSDLITQRIMYTEAP